MDNVRDLWVFCGGCLFGAGVALAAFAVACRLPKPPPEPPKQLPADANGTAKKHRTMWG